MSRSQYTFTVQHMARKGCLLRAHIYERNKDIFVRIKAISALGPSVYGPFCEVHLIPFTRKDEKDRPIK